MLEQHIKDHDYNSSLNNHGQFHCNICKNILEHYSEDDDSNDSDFGYSSSSSTSSSSSCFPISSSSESLKPAAGGCLNKKRSHVDLLQQLQNKVYKNIEKDAVKVPLPKRQKELKIRSRKQSSCEHILRKKHKYCSVCYQCCKCEEIFLRKNYSSSQDVSDVYSSSESTNCGHFTLTIPVHPVNNCVID